MAVTTRARVAATCAQQHLDQRPQFDTLAFYFRHQCFCLHASGSLLVNCDSLQHGDVGVSPSCHQLGALRRGRRVT